MVLDVHSYFACSTGVSFCAVIALLISFGLLVQGFQIENVFALGSENAFLPVVFGDAQFASEPESTPTPTPASSATPTVTSTFTALPTNTSTSTATPTAITNASLPEFGKGVVAFNDNPICDNSTAGGVKFGDTDDVWINGGSVFANGCLLLNNNCSVTVTGGDISYVGGIFGGCSNINPLPQYVDFMLSVDSFSVPEPDCSNLPLMGAYAGGGRIIPGIYQSIQVPPNNTLILDPGLYCLQGDFLHFGNSLFGEGVTIFMQSGDLIIYGSDIYLTAPISVTLPMDGILDVLLSVDQTNNAEIILLGNSQWQVEGVIFGPSSVIKLLGSSPVDLNVQLLGWNIEFLGVYPITISFSDEHGYPK